MGKQFNKSLFYRLEELIRQRNVLMSNCDTKSDWVIKTKNAYKIKDKIKIQGKQYSGYKDRIKDIDRQIKQIEHKLGIPPSI